MLKCDFHIHTREDPKDRNTIDYGAKELIDFAAEKGFDVLSITLHGKLFWNERLDSYARKKKILLIPGIEARIDDQDVLILLKRPDPSIEQIASFEELKRYAKKNRRTTIVIMPHLFYPKYFPRGFFRFFSLIFGKDKDYSFADAFEFTHFYTRWLNPNRKAVSLAKSLRKPIVGNSDAHRLWQMDRTYSLIDSKKDVDSVFSAIKGGKVSVVTEPFFWRTLLYLVRPKKVISDLSYKKGL